MNCRRVLLPLPTGSPYNVAMSYRSLAEFLEELDHAGELTRVGEETAPDENMAAAVADGVRANGPALLFGNVLGRDLPILANSLATERRICRALGVDSLAEAEGQIARLLNSSDPTGWLDRLKGGSRSMSLGAIAPREVKSAACQQIVRLASDVHLDELPFQISSNQNAGDGVRVLHSAVVLSAEADSHCPVAGRFDLQQMDATRLAICWSPSDVHARLLLDYRERGRKMPAAVVIGGDPCYLLAAASPIPPDADLAAVAGLLRGKPLDVAAGRNGEIFVPAEAEIVLEGTIDPMSPPVEAAGFYSPLGNRVPSRQAAVFEVSALTHRANPIFAASILSQSGPPHELCTTSRAMHRIFRPLIQAAMPDLVDFDLPEFAAGRHWAVLAIRKTHAGQTHRAAHAAWGLSAMQFAKMLVVVDSDVEICDPESVLAAISKNVDPARDVFYEDGPADPLDPATPSDGLARRMAMDATRK